MLKPNRLALTLLHDLLATSLAFALSLYLRVGDAMFVGNTTPWLIQMGIFAATCLTVFTFSGVHKGVWRYISVRDLAVILRGVTIAVLLFVPISFMLTRLEGMPRSVPAIAWFVLMAFMGGSRLLVRLLQEGRLENFWHQNKQPRTRVLVVGASDEAEHFIRATLTNKESPYQVVGVVDEKGSRVGREIHSIRILGSMQNLSAILDDLKKQNKAPSRLVLTKSASRATNFETFLTQAQQMGLALSRLPSMTELHDNLQSAQELRPIALEDLLGRPETLLDQNAITALIKDKRVFITGAGGTIGAELSRQIAAIGPSELILTDNGEFNLYSIDLAIREKHSNLVLHSHIADVRDAGRINQLFSQFKPQIIFHAAALKHVPIAEANIRETLLTNVQGTQNVANAAAGNGAAVMVLISTDKAVRPTSIMGATKRIAEIYCQALDHENKAHTRFLTVRFGNVLGSTGSVVPRFREQLAKGGPLTVTHPEITRFFMTVREAVELVLQASAYAARKDAARGRIMVLDMGKPIKIADLARQIIRLAGLEPDKDIQITYTGLRPGEKLYEEIFDESEKLSQSGADGVLLAAAIAQPLDWVEKNIRECIESAQNQTQNESLHRSTIHTLVPEFKENTDNENTPIPDKKTATHDRK